MVVLSRCLSNSSPDTLRRAITAYRSLDQHVRDQPRPRAHVKRAKRLSGSELTAVIDRYRNGATVYELARDFGITRDTVARHLKQAGVIMRGQSPTTDQIDRMVTLYESGLSLAAVGYRVGFSARTVELHIKRRGVRTRDSHGRESDHLPDQ